VEWAKAQARRHEPEAGPVVHEGVYSNNTWAIYFSKDWT